MSDPYVGTIITTVFNYAPDNWLPCDGRLLAIRDYAALYAIIGTRYGGDAVNTFALPDLRGRTAVGQGNGPNLTPRTIGQKGGAETVTLTTAQMPAHTHTAMAATYASASIPSSAYTWGGDANVPLFSNGAADTAMNPQAISVAGSGSAHNNMSPFIALNYIICVAGLFPDKP